MNITVYHKNSEKMSEIDTATIDLVVTSPPYWNIVDYNHPEQLGVGLTYRHFVLLLEKSLLECMRVVKKDGFIIVIAGDIRAAAERNGKGERPKIYPLHSDIIQSFRQLDFDFFAHYIWRKMGINKARGKIVYGSVGTGKNKGLAAPPFLYSDLLIEHILIFRKPGLRVRIPMEQRLADPGNILLLDDVKKWVDPLWLFDSPTNPYHPATFPPEMVSRLIKMHSLTGETILDPFMGSGTTLEAALALGRHAVGYEINDNYVDSFRRRHPQLIRVSNQCFRSITGSNR